uniref:Uncharacterized protein n=1 Tax=Rhizobium leguminosarum TaxID=384 RepID=A0A154IDZ3_RHILE|nr:hypothetical protein [Rhizobium leguminosarum]KZA98317.1 hypothetical protein A4A59_28040 [Rhizobium leguminosarum]
MITGDSDQLGSILNFGNTVEDFSNDSIKSFKFLGLAHLHQIARDYNDVDPANTFQDLMQFVDQHRAKAWPETILATNSYMDVAKVQPTNTRHLFSVGGHVGGP